jgi:class 3 adenylate cyclase
MASKVREKILSEKLAALGKAHPWSPRVMEKLAGLIRTGTDEQLFRINPLRFASENAVVESESIDLFLHGTRQGLFQMDWNLVCPTCGDSVESFKALNKLNSHFRCSVCDLNTEATLDDFIQVNFTISAEVREIVFHHPEALSVQDYHLKYHFNPTATIPGGPRFIDAVPSLVKGLSYINPGQRKRFEVETTGGVITLNDLMHHENVTIQVGGAPADKPVSVSARLEGGKLTADRIHVPAGRLTVTMENKTAGKASLLILNFPPGFEKKPLKFDAFLSGKKLLSTQTFRSLFSSEVIQGTEGIGVRDITILFTDLKGSTALYERIGDLKAFSLVHQHFDQLGRVITKNSGAFVKTIGDAVMASFLSPVDAVKAGLEMIREIAKFNRSFTTRDVILKIGIHKGPCIAVTLNDRLDYFGQTVNVAARVQGLAGAEEIYVTEDVFSHPGVKAQLKGFRVFRGKARLKGIQEEVQVYKIVEGGSSPGGSRRATPSRTTRAAK